MSVALEVSSAPLKADLEALSAKLTGFNLAQYGAAEREDLMVLHRGQEGELLAGLSGYTAWGWLYVQWLFVEEALRGQGMAGLLLARAEEEARARGCLGAHIDTFSDHAIHSYEKAGYRVFGVLEDFPPGQKRTFLQKRL